MEIIHLEKEEDFKELINTDKILIDFFATWSIPTLVLLENGKEVKRNIGFIDKNNLEKFLK